MIGILGGMGTQAGLDFCNKLAMLNRGKSDQEYPLFILYNKSNIPDQFFLYLTLQVYCKNQAQLEFPFHLKFQSLIYIFY